jgi:phospholipase/carboxylesterase
MDDLHIDPDLVLWSQTHGDHDDRPLLVLLHGYGADENDLFGLAPFLPDGFDLAAVRAPLAPPWPAPGYSWYPIEDVIDADLAGRDPARVTAAASAVLDWVDASAGSRAVGLVGFSQGASVALQAVRMRPERFAFAVNLSGYVAPGPLPHDAELAARRLPVFWGRGAQDDVIPPALVEHTTQWLPAHTDLSGRVYPGLTHSVSEEELGDVRVFLEKRLAAL